MESPLEQFQALDAARKRFVHFRLCEHALRRWEEYLRSNPKLTYVEGVTGTQQKIDPKLPNDAFISAKHGRDLARVENRYGEPITAIQDLDLKFPDPIEFAYYSVYNLFRRYVLDDKIDDWIIANQALSAETQESEWQRLFIEAIDLAVVEEKVHGSET